MAFFTAGGRNPLSKEKTKTKPTTKEYTPALSAFTWYSSKGIHLTITSFKFHHMRDRRSVAVLRKMCDSGTHHDLGCLNAENGALDWRA